jgi:hypothetical protein
VVDDLHQSWDKVATVSHLEVSEAMAIDTCVKHQDPDHKATWHLAINKLVTSVSHRSRPK